MTLPTSLHSFGAEVDAFQRACNSKRGIRIEKGDRTAAYIFTARLHQTRVLDRKRNCEVYEPGDPMYGHSEFDSIRCTRKEDSDGSWWVYLEKTDILTGVVEELADDEA